MMKKGSARNFAIAAAVGLSLALTTGVAVGQLGGSGAAVAADPLPDHLSADGIGDGGVDLSTVRTIAETNDFQVWQARDHSSNTCIIAVAKATANAASYCGGEDVVAKHGLSGSMQVGIADEGDTSIPVLQTYLLPDGADAAWAQERIAGSRSFGQLVVRYGAMELERSATIAVPANGEEVLLKVFGRDSL